MSMSADKMLTMSTRPQKLSAKFRIGSKNSPLNYQFRENVFHSDDTPDEKSKAKLEVKKSLQSNILSNDKPEWNISTEREKLPPKRTNLHAELGKTGMHVYNYRAEKLPSAYPFVPSKPNKFNTGIHDIRMNHITPGESFGCKRIDAGISKQLEELPNHPDLMDKKAWNCSTEISKSLNQQKYQNSEENRTKKSIKSNRELSNYVSPEKRVEVMNESIRHEKKKTKNSGYIQNN